MASTLYSVSATVRLLLPLSIGASGVKASGPSTAVRA